MSFLRSPARRSVLRVTGVALAVGLATACHFIAALPATPHTDHPPHPLMLEYDMSDNALRSELLKAPLRLDAGHVLLPDGPGLGVELDAKAVERYRIC